ncbi:MAG: acetylxylan esterase [Candidatus Hydrogenedentes bacterium]|nr:acetylxylan esterase [Candidatus Hydrogenedentota bacterium]
MTRATLICLMLCLQANVVHGQDWKVLPETETPRDPLKALLIEQIDTALDKRAEAYEAVENGEQLEAYQKRLHDFFIRQLGGLPERTALNARVVGTLERDGYRVEKIIYESLPGFYVTAALFLPATPGPYPGVLVPCGHSGNGKAMDVYQRACIDLALNGIAALIYDPVGQGERYQVLGDDGKPLSGGTKEHTLLGVTSMLVGRNTATYRIWDGMRGIDYLLTRDDIDPERIGCTGNSGGGTLTSYLMALDERIKVAAPSCYLTSFRNLVRTIGPQDAEQDIFGQIAFGMDHADYILMRAPRPTLMCVATSDYFGIDGAWSSFREAKRMYTRIGYSDHVDLAETDEEHGFSLRLRESMTRWMVRWFFDENREFFEPEFDVLTEAEIQCTPDGQVLLLDGAKSAFEINQELNAALAAGRETFWQDNSKEIAHAKVQELTGIAALSELPEPEAATTDTIAVDGGSVHKITLTRASGMVIPALVFSPGSPTGDAVLLVHEDGKEAVAGQALALMKKGTAVMAPDLSGFGETTGKSAVEGWYGTFSPNWQHAYLAYLMGDSLLGMRAEDIAICARYFRGNQATQKGLQLAAAGEAAPPALHIAALEPDLFSSVVLDNMIPSWTAVVDTPLHVNQLTNAVHGALEHYDLPDLVRSLGDTVSLSAPVDAKGNPMGS